MPFQIIVAIGPRRRRPKPTMRTIARAIADLQIAEGMALHAQRDRCIMHALEAAAARHHLTPVIPRRLMRDAEWVHRHIEAPGIRIQARAEDRWRAEQ